MYAIEKMGGSVAVLHEAEANMMNMMQGCSGGLMATGGIVTYGSLILVGAASIKYLFFSKSSAG